MTTARNQDQRNQLRSGPVRSAIFFREKGFYSERPAGRSGRRHFRFVPAAMDAQKEALRRIIGTLANKDEELRSFLDEVDVTRTGLQEESRRVTSELEAELDSLRSALEGSAARLRDVIREEARRKEAELQRQLSDGAAALTSCRDLLGFADRTLGITNEEEFLAVGGGHFASRKQEAGSVTFPPVSVSGGQADQRALAGMLTLLTLSRAPVARVTMAPAFRMSTRPAASDGMSRFAVDFGGERAGLLRLDFLPVPRAPEIDESGCVVRDNSITVAWRPGGGGGGPVERYDVEHRKAGGGGGGGWERVGDITDTRLTLSGLRFDSPFVVVRVRARNRAAAGDFSEPVSLETKGKHGGHDGGGGGHDGASPLLPPPPLLLLLLLPAFAFGFDAATAHAELRIRGDTVTWEPNQGVKGHDARLRGGKENKSSRSATPSPSKTPAAAAAAAGGRGGGRERFAGESYTVLGDREISGGRHYWELRPLPGWKSLSVGVAYRGGLGRFDQLGKSSASWCLYASQWLQSAVAAKHGNRAKALDRPPPPRIGVYCDHDNGQLMFVDVEQLHLLHVFRSRFLQPLVPAFTVWGGGISVATGLQVPSFMESFLSSNHSAAADQTL